jgi:hypothetical protein
MVSEATMFAWNFASFRRVLREPPMSAPKRRQWIHGLWNGMFVVGRPDLFHTWTTASRLERAITGGLRRQYDPPSLQTLVMAEIDPPIFAGLAMVSRPSARFGPPDPRRLVSLRNGELNERFWTVAYDVARVDALLRSDVFDGLVEAIRGTAAGVRVALHDGVVEAFVDSLPSASLVRMLAEISTVFARKLSARSAALSPNPADGPLLEAWAKVAAARGLTFDAQRWRMTGAPEGVEVEILLETGSARLATTVRTMLRPPFGCAIWLRKRLPHDHSSLFTRSAIGGVETGNRAFDDTFVVDALQPETARDALSRPGIHQGLLALATDATGVFLHDLDLLVTEDGCASPDRLSTRIDRSVSLANALVPSHEGAYR